MRILLLNTFPVWGGDEKWTINVGKGLKERGHHVVISSMPGSETERQALDSKLITFPFHIGFDIAFWKIPKFRKYLKSNAIEVLICVQNRDIKIGGLAGQLAGVPVIFGRQGLDTMKKQFYHKIAFTKFLDGIITNTESIKKLYEGYGWFKKDFIHVVYDGLIMPENLKKIDLHQEFDLEPGSRVIVGAGRLSEQKRFDLLIKVAEIAKKAKLHWSIIVVGTGKLDSRLKQMAIDRRVDEIIKFVGFRNDVLSIMNSADIFVLTSDSEGMSNALREAMATGRACIATEVFGVEELFNNNRNGLMVKRGDAKGIYFAIEKVLSNAKLKQDLEQRSAQLISTQFTMDNMLNGIESIFEEKLTQSRKGRQNIDNLLDKKISKD